ncbi:MAG: hypothetical protein R3F20_07050 [Planctomycetota bacterium]
MRKQISDSYSLKADRFRQRLDEILDRVRGDSIARMEAGDLIGRQIVANLEPEVERSPEAASVLFAAQIERAGLYLESKGATPLDSAEALVDAHASLAHFPFLREHLERLVEPASRCLADLMKIGSRSTAWAVNRLLLDALMKCESGADRRAAALATFAQLLEAVVADERDHGATPFAVAVATWARRVAPEAGAAIDARLPALVAKEIDELETEVLLQTWRLVGDADPEASERMLRRLVAEERRDMEARQLYRRFLDAHPDRVETLETLLSGLAYVHPDPKLDYDGDLDALNATLAEFYGDREWPWRNQGLVARRHGDSLSALVNLARVMTMSGQPPELMGLLSPVVHGLGFEETARQFARFASPEERERFRLRVLDQIDAEPKSDAGCEKLIGHLERQLADPELPPEFAPAVRRRLAELHYRLAQWPQARRRFAELHEQAPTVELFAVRLAETAFFAGDEIEARRRLDGRFSDRVRPHVNYVRSLVASADGDPRAALELAERALDAMASAQQAGREEAHRNWIQIHQKVEKVAGDEIAHGALVSMLQNDVHASRHRDLTDLEAVLERRIVELALANGDVEHAREFLAHFESERGPNPELNRAGLRAALAADATDHAEFFLGRLEETDGEGGAEVALARAVIAARRGRLEEAERALGALLDQADEPRARLALAALQAERGDEAGALSLIGRKLDQRATEANRLRGILLERLGDAENAREAYRRAPGDGALRRFGLLSVAIGLAGPEHRRELEEGLRVLQGFQDSEAIEAQARGRAALAPDLERAAETLGVYRKRLGGEAERRVATLLACARATLGDVDGVLEEREAGMLPPALEAWTDLSLLVRRLSNVDGADDAALRDLVHDLDVVAMTEVDGRARNLAAILRTVSGEADLDFATESDTPGELVVAAGIAALRHGLEDALAERLREIAGSNETIAALAAATLELAKGRADATMVGAWRTEADRWGAPAPFTASDFRRVAIIRALRDEPGTSPDVLRDPDGVPADLRELVRLRAALDADDVTGILTALAELARRQPDGAWAGFERDIRERITLERERPSPAWASARMRTAGKRSRVFLPAVHDYWREALADEELAGTARRHLALLELNRAHEEEAAGKEATDSWSEAHRAWADLLACEASWAELNEEHGAEAVAAVRAAIPRWMLDAHLRRAEFQLDARKLAHAIRHARIAAGSPLVDEAQRPWLRDRIYTVFAPDVDRLLARRDYHGALAQLDRVLLCDPGHDQARRELIHVVSDAISRSFGVLDAFTKRPDPSTVLELAASMKEYLVIVERHALEMAEGDAPEDPTTAERLAITLRGIGFLRFHRDRDPAGAAAILDRAAALVPATGPVGRGIQKLRSEVGVRDVASRLDAGAAAVDSRAALAEIDSLLERDPDNRGLRTQRVRALVADDQPEAALDAAREIFESARRGNDPAAVREATELINQVQSRRETERKESRHEDLDGLIASGNWRAAQDLYRELSVGHEDDPELIARHVEILLGLHKVRIAKEQLRRLGGRPEVKEQRRILEARVTCLEYMAAKGGDVYGAYELYERRDIKRCQALLSMLSNADARCAGARFLNAICQYELEGLERARPLVEEAQRIAVDQDAMWVIDLLQKELPL